MHASSRTSSFNPRESDWVEYRLGGKAYLDPSAFYISNVHAQPVPVGIKQHVRIQ